MFGRDLAFGHADFRRSARAHVAGRQIQHAGAVAGFGHADQRAAAGLFHVVGVGGDGQYVEAHTRAASFLRNSSRVHFVLEGFHVVDGDYRHFVIVAAAEFRVEVDIEFLVIEIGAAAGFGQHALGLVAQAAAGARVECDSRLHSPVHRSLRRQ